MSSSIPLSNLGCGKGGVMVFPDGVSEMDGAVGSTLVLGVAVTEGSDVHAESKLSIIMRKAKNVVFIFILIPLYLDILSSNN
jgi:hypothetical protein